MRTGAWRERERLNGRSGRPGLATRSRRWEGASLVLTGGARRLLAVQLARKTNKAHHRGRRRRRRRRRAKPRAKPRPRDTELVAFSGDEQCFLIAIVYKPTAFQIFFTLDGNHGNEEQIEETQRGGTVASPPGQPVNADRATGRSAGRTPWKWCGEWRRRRRRRWRQRGGRGRAHQGRP